MAYGTPLDGKVCDWSLDLHNIVIRMEAADSNIYTFRLCVHMLWHKIRHYRAA